MQRWIRHADLLPSARILMLEILCIAGNGKGQCWASNETLAANLNMTDRQVRSLLAVLAAGGWIVIERKGKSKFSRRSITIGPACSPDCTWKQSSGSPGSRLPG